MDYACKNKLQLWLREQLIEIENTIVEDLEDLKEKITKIVIEGNTKFPRCTPEKVSFYFLNAEQSQYLKYGNCGVSTFFMFQIIPVKQ